MVETGRRLIYGLVSGVALALSGGSIWIYKLSNMVITLQAEVVAVKETVTEVKTELVTMRQDARAQQSKIDVLTERLNVNRSH